MVDQRYNVLFEPVRIGPVTAPNRFSVAPYANGNSYLQPNGAIGNRAMRAEGGWGIVGMQLTEIDPTSDLSGLPYERLWDDGDVKVHARSVEKIHEHGALASIELGHTGLRSRGIEKRLPDPWPVKHAIAEAGNALFGQGDGQVRHPAPAAVAPSCNRASKESRLRHRLCLCGA